MIVDLFAGPGGWSQGLRALGLSDIGIEWNAKACATRRAAGHETIEADVTELDPRDFAGAVGFLASPPCQDFSLAGKRAGISGDRGQLTLEPYRWLKELDPEWIAFEQVPQVLPYWEEYAEWLQERGYSTWTGKLRASDYGVPTTRQRAILMASKTREVVPPPATHFKDREPKQVTMLEAVGYGFIDQPCPGLTSNGLGTGKQQRLRILRNIEEGRFIPPPAGVMPCGEPRMQPEEMGVIQSFPRDYPWQGSKTAKKLQVADAVPPGLATAIVRQLVS